VETTEDQKPNRPRVWDFCCDSRGNSSRTDMHTQAEQRPCEIEASCGLPMRFGQHSSSKIYGLAHCRPFVFGLLFDSSNSPACSCVSTTCLLHRKRVSQQCEAASCTSFRRWNNTDLSLSSQSLSVHHQTMAANCEHSPVRRGGTEIPRLFMSHRARVKSP
jgi:hypothetical protein